LPKPPEADCGVTLRDPEHIADFQGGQALEIQQCESSLYRFQTPYGIKEFSSQVSSEQTRAGARRPEPPGFAFAGVETHP